MGDDQSITSSLYSGAGPPDMRAQWDVNIESTELPEGPQKQFVVSPAFYRSYKWHKIWEFSPKFNLFSHKFPLFYPQAWDKQVSTAIHTAGALLPGLMAPPLSPDWNGRNLKKHPRRLDFFGGKNWVDNECSWKKKTEIFFGTNRAKRWRWVQVCIVVVYPLQGIVHYWDS